MTATNATLYLNGVPATRTATHNAVNFNSSFLIGSDRANPGRNFKGQIDEACVYTRALSQNEIREVMHLTRNLPTADASLHSYIQMNELLGVSLVNHGAGSTAILNGGAARIASTAPVGSGNSERQTITTNGVKTFANEGIVLTFGSGTLPDGEVCVTRLNRPPDAAPTGASSVNTAAKYWIINNYGNNSSFTSLTGTTATGFGSISASEAAAPSMFKLYKRSTGDFGSGTWNSPVTASGATAGVDGVIDFTNPASSFNSQFTITRAATNWTGATSADWNTAANWSGGVVPSSTDNVVLPATGVTNEVVISSSVTTANLTMESNRTIALAGGGSLTVSGTLTMGGGNITLGDQNMTFGALATVTGAAATKAIVTNGMGTVSRAIAASSNFQFPIAATATTYNPLTIALAAGDPTETWNVRVQSSVNPSAPDNTLCVQRTWNIGEASAGSNNATLTFGWVTGENGSNFSAITGQGLFRHSGSAYSQVTTLGNPGSSPYSATTVSAVTQFSPFVIGQQGGLPVQLVSFTGVFVNGSVRLNWRTLLEINNYGFYVQQRSVGVMEWRSVENSFVAGHGTTNEPHDYAFTHANVADGSWQYRLRQVDLDGTEHFTEPITVSSPTSVKEIAPIEFALKQNYPNPFNPETYIKFSVEQTGRATLEIFNTLGQRVATLFDDVVEAGYYQTVRLNGGNLASGVYMYRLQSGKKNELKKLILLR